MGMIQNRPVTKTGPERPMIQNRPVTNTGPERPFRCLDECHLAMMKTYVNINRLCYLQPRVQQIEEV